MDFNGLTALKETERWFAPEGPLRQVSWLMARPMFGCEACLYNFILLYIYIYAVDG